MARESLHIGHADHRIALPCCGTHALTRRNRVHATGPGMARAPAHRQTPGRSPPNANRKPRGAAPEIGLVGSASGSSNNPGHCKSSWSYRSAREAQGSKLRAVLMGRISVKGGSAWAPGHSGPPLWPPIRRKGDRSPVWAVWLCTKRSTDWSPIFSIGQCAGTNPPGADGRGWPSYPPKRSNRKGAVIRM